MWNPIIINFEVYSDKQKQTFWPRWKQGLKFSVLDTDFCIREIIAPL